MIILIFFIFIFQLSQTNVTEVWDKLKDTDSKAKNLDAECINLKEALGKSHIQIRSLNTSCSLLVGILVPLIKQNKELKEQRRIFEYLYKRLIQFQNQIIILKDQNNYDKTDQIKFNNFIDTNIYFNNNNNQRNDHAIDDDFGIEDDDTENLSDIDENFELENESSVKNKINKSKKQKKLNKRIEKLLNENDSACGNDSSRSKYEKRQQKQQIIEHLNETRAYAKHQLAIKLNTVNNKPSKICLFRKAAIVILAAHRLIYFNNHCSKTTLNVFDSIETRHKFIYAQPTAITKHQIKKPDLKCM